MDTRAYLAWGSVSLHLRWVDQDRDTGVTAAKNVQYVLDGSAARRGHDPNATRKHWQWSLSGSIEKSFSRQLGLKLLEGDLERSSTLWIEVFGGELQLASRFEDGDAPARSHLQALRMNGT
jgi:hypothetical protein